MHKTFSIMLFLTCFLTACTAEETEISKLDNPKLVAVAFFQAIYNEKDINKAASVCSPKLSRLLLHYRTSQSIAKHMFNMSFEKVTDIRPDETGVKIRERFQDKAVVTVYIEGYYDDSKIKDVKRLSLIQNDKGQWIIDKILKDPF